MSNKQNVSVVPFMAPLPVGKRCHEGHFCDRGNITTYFVFVRTTQYSWEEPQEHDVLKKPLLRSIDLGNGLMDK